MHIAVFLQVRETQKKFNTKKYFKCQIIVVKKMARKWPIRMFAEAVAQKFHLKLVQYFIEVRFREHLQPSMQQWNWIIAIVIDAMTILLNGKVPVFQAGFQIKSQYVWLHTLVELAKTFYIAHGPIYIVQSVDVFNCWIPTFHSEFCVGVATCGCLFNVWYFMMKFSSVQ